MALQLEDETLQVSIKTSKTSLLSEYLRKRADRSSNPGHDEHHLGPLRVGHVGDGEHDGRETIKGDDNHDEAREIETNNPEEDHNPTGDIISHPGHCCSP